MTGCEALGGGSCRLLFEGESREAYNWAGAGKRQKGRVQTPRDVEGMGWARMPFSGNAEVATGD